MSIIAAGILSLITAGLPEVMWLGNPVGSASAVSHGMGECGFMEGSALGILENPSLLGISEHGLQVEFSAGMDFFVEKRTRRVYDQFESSIGESEFAFNKGIGFFPGGVALAVRGLDGLPESLAFAAGWRVPAFYGYSYERTVRDAAYVITGDERLDVSGILNEFALAVAFIPSDVFSFGLAGGYVTGSRDVTWEVTHVDPVLDSIRSNRSETANGIVTRGSILFSPDRRVFVSAALEYPMPLSISPQADGDPVTWNVLSETDYDLDMPMILRLGSIYIPGNSLRSRFIGEFFWSSDGSLEFEGENLGMKNSWGVNAGVENTLPGGPVARFGFGYRRSPLASALDRMSFTAGLGFCIGEWNLDLGAGFSPDRWRQTEISGLPSFVAGDSLTVEETDTRVMFSISRVFDL
ncbi:MAG: hypothetical protein KAT09_03920 [Candidatus Aegiribacteria sp.]|nr:hypothetical protein [Candidatus Aegiribacteria sp.]